MSGVHLDLGELGPELRKFAQAVLAGIDPVVRAAATAAEEADPGKCRQEWCPVCALVALVTGEQHPLLAVIAEHSAALAAAVRAVVDETGGAADTPTPSWAPPAGAARTDGPPVENGYHNIPVTVEE